MTDRLGSVGLVRILHPIISLSALFSRRRPVFVRFQPCDEIPEIDNLKGETVIWAHGFRDSGLWDPSLGDCDEAAYHDRECTVRRNA